MRFYVHGRRTSIGGGPIFLIAYLIGLLIYGLVALFVWGFVIIVKLIVLAVQAYQRR